MKHDPYLTSQPATLTSQYSTNTSTTNTSTKRKQVNLSHDSPLPHHRLEACATRLEAYATRLEACATPEQVIRRRHEFVAQNLFHYPAPPANSINLLIVFQLRAVAATPSPRSTRFANLEVPIPEGVCK